MIARHLLIRGVVQGVGYRNAMMLTAGKLAVNGWVRNRHDGSVEAHLEGEAAAVETLLAWSRQGPRGARVSEVVATEAQPAGHRGFNRLPTA